MKKSKALTVSVAEVALVVLAGCESLRPAPAPLTLGMSEADVTKLWGKPDHVTKAATSYGTAEQWAYESGRGGSHYAYFQNGFLTTVQQ